MIIISCVRSKSTKNPNNSAGGGIGFLSDEKRLNVALTRAKFGLYVVGNMDVMQVKKIKRCKLRCNFKPLYLKL